MLGIKQIFRKEEPTGTCPICDVAYKRIKRDLRADCFDASYVITAWTLLCPECGYTLILPGMAKIRPASSVTQEERSEGGEIPVAVSKMDEADEPKADETDVAEAGEKEPEAAEKAEPEAPAVTAAQENAKAISVPNPPAKPAEQPAGAISGKPEEQPAVPSVKAEKKAPAAVKPADTGTGTGNAPKPAEKQDTAGNKASAGAEPKHSDKAEQRAAEVYSDAPKEKKPAAGREPEPDGKRGGEAGTKQAKPEAKPSPPKADSKDNRQDKPKLEKSVPEKRAPALQQKVQPQPELNSMGQGMRPTPPRPAPPLGQPAPFGSGRIGGGFPSGGSFPTSALSNLDSLKAYVQEAEKANGNKAKGGARTQSQTQAQPKKAEPASGNVKTGNAAAKPQEQARPATKDASTTVPVKAAEDDKKTLSAEKKEVKPADNESSGPVDGAEVKNSEKSLSAKNVGDAKTQETGRKPAEAEAVKETMQSAVDTKDRNSSKDSKKLEKQEKAADNAIHDSEEPVEPQDTQGDTEVADGEDQVKGTKAQAMAAAQKLQEKLPPDLAEKIPVISTIAKQQKRAIFISEEKHYLETHVPHTQVIINDLIYDTDNSEMFLRVNGQYGLDRPCVHYNYRTKNGNFFRCTVKYKHEDSIRALDEFEAKRMLEKYPDLYRKFFPDSVSDA